MIMNMTFARINYFRLYSSEKNQIFTSKWVVKKMVNILEELNPGCFSYPNKAFADLYITEIAKKPFNDEKMRLLIPDDTERHIRFQFKNRYTCLSF